MAHLSKFSALLAATAILAGVGAGCGSAASPSNSRAAAVRQTTTEFVNDLLITSNPKQLCSLLAPSEIHKYGGSQKKCTEEFTFVSAFVQGFEASNPQGRAYAKECFSATQAAILSAPISFVGNTASLAIRPQGVPAQAKFGNTTLSCSGGGTAYLVLLAGKWLIVSAPEQQ